jgi:hypothetical protein
MPILLWYMPFTMFYGACDLLFAGLEMEMNEDRPAAARAGDQLGPDNLPLPHAS